MVNLNLTTIGYLRIFPQLPVSLNPLKNWASLSAFKFLIFFLFFFISFCFFISPWSAFLSSFKSSMSFVKLSLFSVFFQVMFSFRCRSVFCYINLIVFFFRGCTLSLSGCMRHVLSGEFFLVS